MPGPETTQSWLEERGSALIVVLVFTLGVLAMISFLLPTTRQAVEAEGEMQRNRGLNFVLQTGINDAMNELVNGDLDGDGVGARGTGLPSSNAVHDPTSGSFAPGIEVNVGGTSLGFYKAYIDDSLFSTDGTLDLVVVAVWPDFVRPRQTLSSRVRFRSEHLSIKDKNALSFAGMNQIGHSDGSVDDTGRLFKNGWDTSELKIEDENDDNAAVNVGDPRLWSVLVHGGDSSDADHNGNTTDFGNDDSNTDTSDNKTSVVEDSRTELKGWDKNASPGTQGSGESTVTNAPSKNYVNDQALKQMATNWRDHATYATTTTDIAGDANGGSDFTSSYAGPIDIGDINSTTGAATDVVRLAPGKSVVTLDGVTIKGKGTLIVPRTLRLTNNAKIEWEGNIVVAPVGGWDGELDVDDGELKLKGNLVLAPEPTGNKYAKLEVNEGKVDVEGAVLGISNKDSGDVIFEMAKKPFKSEPDVKVKGLLAFLGEQTSFRIQGTTVFSSRAKLHVDGATAFATPKGRKLKNLDIRHRAHLHLKFKDADFQTAVTNAIPPGNPPPPFAQRMGYLEQSAGALKSGATGTASGDWTGELKKLYDAIGAKTDGSSTIGTP